MVSNLMFEFASWRDPTDVWTLYGPGQGDRGVVLGKGPKGLHDEDTEPIWTSYAFQIGANYGGNRINKRDVILPCEIIDTADQPWQLNDSDFRKAWSYDYLSTLTCTTNEWGTRYLPVQLGKTPDFDPETDPFKDHYGHAIYTGTAGYPRWKEDDVVDSWVSTHDSTDGSWASGTVKVSNPTDCEMWLMWVLQAYGGAIYKIPDFSFADDRFERATTDAARVVTMPSLIDGEHVVINTDENADQVTSDLDTQIWQRMRGVRFLYPVPAYTDEIELPVQVQNAPAGVGVQVRCPRNWSRPWGLD